MTPEGDAAKALTKNPLGPTGKTVAANVDRLRRDQNLTFAALSELLSQIERPIPPLGLRKIVAQTRRVDADDLVALAVALGVSPITLLIEDGEQSDAEVLVTGLAAPYDAESLWDWLTARAPLRYRNEFEFFSKAWPRWLQQRHPTRIDRADELRDKSEQLRQLMAQSDAVETPHGDD